MDNFSYEQLIHKALHRNPCSEQEPTSSGYTTTRAVRRQRQPLSQSPSTQHALRTRITANQRSSCVAISHRQPHIQYARPHRGMKASSLHHYWLSSSFMNFHFSHFTLMSHRHTFLRHLCYYSVLEAHHAVVFFQHYPRHLITGSLQHCPISSCSLV